MPASNEDDELAAARAYTQACQGVIELLNSTTCTVRIGSCRVCGESGNVLRVRRSRSRLRRFGPGLCLECVMGALTLRFVELEESLDLVADWAAEIPEL